MKESRLDWKRLDAIKEICNMTSGVPEKEYGCYATEEISFSAALGHRLAKDGSFVQPPPVTFSSNLQDML
jgi:hypothetical protein